MSSTKEHQQVVIFDFDGTLADVAELIRKLYSDMAAVRGWPPLTDRDYKMLRKGTITQAIRWVGIRPWQIPALLREGRLLFRHHSSEIELFSGISSVVKDLYKKQWHIYVLSSNSEPTIRKVLKSGGINEQMSILKRPSLFGKAKSINTLVGKNGYNKANVWMIGDEERDIEGAKKAGVNSIAVAWGLQDISVLKRTGPTHVAVLPADILEILVKGKKR